MYWHIYMESKVMTLMNLFSGQQWRKEHREQTWGHGGRRGGRRGAVWREEHRNVQCHVCKRDGHWEFVVWLTELKQGSVKGWRVAWGGRWEGGPGGRVHGCTCGWFLLMYNRKPQNSVKQLSFNLKKFF